MCIFLLYLVLYELIIFFENIYDLWKKNLNYIFVDIICCYCILF